MKINTNTKIKNLIGEDFKTIKDEKEALLTLGDVLFGTLTNASGVELKISWALLPKLALENEEIELNDEQKTALITSVEQAAKLPSDRRYGLVVYGRTLDILNGKVEETKKGKK
jgi:hypothetical protein